MIDPNWGRWIFASVSNYFNTISGAASIPFFVEGADKADTEELEYFEFRINGPEFKEISRNFWNIRVEINVFCEAKRQKENFHRIHALTGVAASMFANSIECFKFGTGAGDDSTSFICLQLESKGGEDVRVHHFGQLEPDLLAMQATVDGCYEGFLDANP